MKALSVSSRRRLRQATAHLDSIAGAAARLSEARVSALLRRAEMSSAPDGFPSSSMPDGGSSGGADVTLTSVEAAAQARMGRGVADPVVDGARAVLDDLRVAAEAVRHADGVLSSLEADAARFEGRQPATVECPSADGNPQERDGMCNTCRSTWQARGRPNKEGFWRWRRGQADECPPPEYPHAVRVGPYRRKETK